MAFGPGGAGDDRRADDAVGGGDYGAVRLVPRLASEVCAAGLLRSEVDLCQRPAPWPCAGVFPIRSHGICGPSGELSGAAGVAFCGTDLRLCVPRGPGAEGTDPGSAF